MNYTDYTQGDMTWEDLLKETNLRERFIIKDNLQEDIRDIICDGFSHIEVEYKRVIELYVGASVYGCIRKLGRDLDPVLTADILRTGLMANIYGANIIVSQKTPINTLLFVAQDHTMSVMLSKDVKLISPYNKFQFISKQ